MTFYQGSKQQARLASAYIETDSGFEASPALAPEVSGGGLYSTVSDYLRFMRALLNRGRLDGAQILTPASVDAMFKNQISDIPVTPLATQVLPFYDADAVKLLKSYETAIYEEIK